MVFAFPAASPRTADLLILALTIMAMMCQRCGFPLRRIDQRPRPPSGPQLAEVKDGGEHLFILITVS